MAFELWKTRMIRGLIQILICSAVGFDCEYCKPSSATFSSVQIISSLFVCYLFQRAQFP